MRIILLLSSLFLVAVDQLSKYIIRAKGGFYICNKALAFGLSFSSAIAIFLILLILLLFLNLKFQTFNLKLISNFKFQILNFSPVILFAFLLIVFGGLSNIIDRFYFGCVIDFIDLKFWPVFNLADVYITMGGIMIIIRTTDFCLNSRDSTEQK